MTGELPVVLVGQVWVDNDPRMNGRRRLRVDGFKGETQVLCTVLTDGKGVAVDRATTVARRRFRPTSNGYRLESA